MALATRVRYHGVPRTYAQLFGHVCVVAVTLAAVALAATQATKSSGSTAPQEVVISEFMALNQGAVPVEGPAGAAAGTPDWLELHNPGQQDVDLQVGTWVRGEGTRISMRARHGPCAAKCGVAALQRSAMLTRYIYQTVTWHRTDSDCCYLTAATH